PPKDETSDNRRSMQPQTHSRNRLCVWRTGGVVPHIIIRSSRPRFGEFESPAAKKTFATLSANSGNRRTHSITSSARAKRQHRGLGRISKRPPAEGRAQPLLV